MIGITGRRDTSARLPHAPMHAVGETYVHAIHRVGGIPIIVPPVMTEEDWPGLLERLDGLLLSGGEDIDPAHYRHPREQWIGRVDAERDRSELGLVRRWISTQKPLLAICRGHQLLNVALGGTLFQEISADVPHALDHAYAPGRLMEHPAHTVDLVAGSRLAAVLGGTHFEVNSAHHQAVARPGDNLKITTHAPDGVVEAIELSEHPFCLGVQWHPEAMLSVSATMLPLFAAFVGAANGA